MSLGVFGSFSSALGAVHTRADRPSAHSQNDVSVKLLYDLAVWSQHLSAEHDQSYRVILV